MFTAQQQMLSWVNMKKSELCLVNFKIDLGEISNNNIYDELELNLCTVEDWVNEINCENKYQYYPCICNREVDKDTK